MEQNKDLEVIIQEAVAKAVANQIEIPQRCCREATRQKI